VRHALGKHVFVMAHFSHAYPDGCCIYFSFAGSAHDTGTDWEARSCATYDRAWKDALAAAVDAGGTLSHHHGVGRSKAPRLRAELGVGVDVVRAMQRVFDPKGILNPGNLLPSTSRTTATTTTAVIPTSASVHIDRTSLLVSADAKVRLTELEVELGKADLTLGVENAPDAMTVGEWIARGAPAARDPWLDPVDHLIAGFEARLPSGAMLSVRPAPRRAVGPDLVALVFGMNERFATVTRAWIRIHPIGVPRPTAHPFTRERNPALSEGEVRLLDALAAKLG
jgi:alkyldihydroxyacetonephosphate synthase